MRFGIDNPIKSDIIRVIMPVGPELRPDLSAVGAPIVSATKPTERTIWKWDPSDDSVRPVVLTCTVQFESADLGSETGPLPPAVEDDFNIFADYLERLGAEADANPNGDAARRFERLRARSSAGTLPLGEFLSALAAPLETDQDPTT